MNEYTHIPMMSSTAVRTILATLGARAVPGRELFVVEYGSGHSTKFFVDQLVGEGVHARYVAVERSALWYDKMRVLFPGGVLEKNVWPLRAYTPFLHARPQNRWDVPPECLRLTREQRKMKSVRCIAKFLIQRKSFWYDAKYSTRVGPVAFEYFYIYEGFKDQYGESPHKHLYIRKPLTGLIEVLRAGRACHAVFIIDGGPRADVVAETFALVDAFQNLTVDIFLLEAYRGYYHPILSSRSGGRFIAAEKNETLDGRLYIEEKETANRTQPSCAALFDEPSVAGALERELWHFTNLS